MSGNQFPSQSFRGARAQPVGHVVQGHGHRRAPGGQSDEACTVALASACGRLRAQTVPPKSGL
eukprot:2751123-Alexandrium_andersonii.AAC.1